MKKVVVYVPGLLSVGWLHSLSLKANMFFLRRGYDFRVVHSKPMATIRERGINILEAVKSISDLSNVHIVSHSAGGLGARYAAFYRPFNTVTTISTPHHGSIFADKYSKEPPRDDDNDFEKAYKQLTSDYMKQFNKLYPDNPQVKYYSMGFTGDTMVTPESARWGTYLGTGNCSHLMQTSPWFGGQFSKTFQIVLNNLDSL